MWESRLELTQSRVTLIMELEVFSMCPNMDTWIVRRQGHDRFRRKKLAMTRRQESHILMLCDFRKSWPLLGFWCPHLWSARAVDRCELHSVLMFSTCFPEIMQSMGTQLWHWLHTLKLCFIWSHYGVTTSAGKQMTLDWPWNMRKDWISWSPTPSGWLMIPTWSQL
jgi:hypothetical protein